MSWVYSAIAIWAQRKFVNKDGQRMENPPFPGSKSGAQKTLDTDPLDADPFAFDPDDPLVEEPPLSQTPPGPAIAENVNSSSVMSMDTEGMRTGKVDAPDTTMLVTVDGETFTKFVTIEPAKVTAVETVTLTYDDHEPAEETGTSVHGKGKCVEGSYAGESECSEVCDGGKCGMYTVLGFPGGIRWSCSECPK